MRYLYRSVIPGSVFLASVTIAIAPPPLMAIPIVQSEHPKLQASRLESEAKALLDNGDFNAALQKFEAALSLYRAAGSSYKEAMCLLAIGFIHHRLADYTTAVATFTETLPIWQDINNPLMELIALNNIGQAYASAGQYRRALEFYQQALPLAQQQDPIQLTSSPWLQLAQAIVGKEEPFESLESLTLFRIAHSYRHLRNYSQALQFFERVLTLSRSIGDRQGEAAALNNLGLTYSDSRQFNRALDYYQQSLALSREIDYASGEATTLNNLGLLYDNQQQYLQALDYYQQAIAIQEKIDDRSGMATSFNNIGAVYIAQGKFRQGRDKFHQALSLYKDLQDSAGQAIALNNLASALERLGMYPEAEKSYQQALEISEGTDDIHTIAATQNNLGGLYLARGQYDRARSEFESALNRCPESCDSVGYGRRLNNLGLFFTYSGDYSEAQVTFQRALTHVQRIGDRQGESAILANMALLYQNRGRYQEALRYYSQAKAIVEKLGREGDRQRLLTNIGAVYATIAEYDKALQFLNSALEIQRRIGDLQAEGTTLNSIGIIHRYQDKTEEMFENLQAALSILNQIDSPREAAAVLTNLGESYRLMGDYQKALESHEKALEIQRQIGDRLREAETLNNIGGVYYSQSQWQRGRESIEQAVAIFHELGAVRGLSNSLANLGGYYENSGNISQAIAYYKEAISWRESIANTLTVEELKSSFFSELSGAEIYARLINLLWNQQQYKLAWQYVEKAKAQAFLDRLVSGTRDFRLGSSDKLIAKGQKIQAKINVLRQQLNDLLSQSQNQWNQDKMKELKDKLDSAEREYADWLVEMKLTSPQYAEYSDILDGSVASLSEIQAQLDAETTLLQYFIMRDRVLAFVITQQGLKPHSLSVSKAELKQLLMDEFKQYRFRYNSTSSIPPSLQELYRVLIAPLEADLKTELIGIVPHNLLHYLPFSALHDGETYWSAALFTLPSASVLPYLPRKKKTKNEHLVALGNPRSNEYAISDLPYATEEVNAIASLFESSAIFLGKEATEKALKLQSKTAGILHIAAHGKYEKGNPLFSRLYLTPDSDFGENGRLEAHEIYFELNLTAATNLVVLSACQTQMGEVNAGDEIVALNRAFLYAGTPSVLATLWSVNDKATGLLVHQFYTYLRAGHQKAEALALAQSYLRDNYPEYSSPYYWAAFVLTGDGGFLATER
ncbi:tetratricopeptide repeat protein [Phormidium sp. CCY1219]|uniref:tetratricopeptide repeat protein n=1 Tax=Phormidium sp. CCY1219 TaxID=2886104 RepID=UPI002D1F697C|nr:tetratricopeptide repeat protein [Phormidium sp. CCY1219]MEB3831937.1 tetratricopeptide repeat protein [Phormidium sp. CCY1219]